MESPRTQEPAALTRLFSPDELWGGAILAVLTAGILYGSCDNEPGFFRAKVTLWQILAGLALVIGGAVLRRRSKSFGEGLCAAGLAGLFAVFLIAVRGFESVPAFAGYGLMALTAVAAVAVLGLRRSTVLLAIALLGASSSLAGLPPLPWLVAAALLGLLRTPLGIAILTCAALHLVSQVEGLTLPPLQGIWALAGAVFFLLLTGLLKALSKRGAWLAAPAAATVLLLSLAVTLEIGRAGLAMGCLLAVPALVWMGETLRAGALRPLVVFLIVVSGGWLVTHYALFGFPEGGAAGLPWLLYGYGLPAAAVGLASWIARRKGAPGFAAVLSWPAAALLFLTVTLVLRQAVEGAHGLRDGTILWLYLPAWALLGWIVWRARRRLRAPLASATAALALLLALPAAAAGAPPECRSAGTATICHLRIAKDAGHLMVEVQGNGGTGFSLYEGWYGSWDLAAEGRWKPADGNRHHLRVRDVEILRLELYGTGGAPRLLDYGPRPLARPAAAPEPVWAPASLPAATRSGPPLERSRRTFSWDLQASGAIIPGQLVRLEIPTPVYAREMHLGNLKLAAGYREILSGASYSMTPPVEVARLAGLRPRTDFFSPRVSWITVPLPETNLPLTTLYLSAPPAPFHRQVVLLEESPPLAVDWTCRPRPPLPCRLALDLSKGELNRVRNAQPKSLAIGFVDGDNPPLPTVDVEVWRRKEDLVFAWPAEGTVQLLAGARSPSDFGWEEGNDLVLASDGKPLPAVVVSSPDEAADGVGGPLAAGLFLAAVVLLGLTASEWRRARRSKALRATGIALVLLGMAPAGVAAGEASYTRAVEVPAPGWVRVPLDEAAIRHARPTLDWIRLAGPQGEEIERQVDHSAALFVDAEAWPALRITGDAPGFHRESGAAVYRLELPGSGLSPRAVSLEMAPGARAGFRLYAPELGAWKLLAEGVRGPESGPWRIPVKEEELAAGSLRLEITGPGDPPHLLRWELEAALPTVLFKAETAGRYRLEYGDGRMEGLLASRLNPPQGEDAVVWIPPGPESARSLPALPGGIVGITAPGLPLRLDRATTAWTLRAAGIRTGEVVRVEMPGEVYDRAGASLDGLFLTVAGRQVPYLRQELHEPGRVTGVRNMGAEVAEWMGTRSHFPRPEEDLPWTQFLLTGPAQPIYSSNVQDWTCERSPYLPCREGRDAMGRRNDPLSFDPPRLTVRPEGPPPPLDVSFWRRRDVLVFVWPAGGPVRLVHLDGKEAPAYDLRVAEEKILARPWRSAYLRPAESPRPEPWPRVSGLAVGAGALLLALRRLLSR